MTSLRSVGFLKDLFRRIPVLLCVVGVVLGVSSVLGAVQTEVVADGFVSDYRAMRVSGAIPNGMDRVEAMKVQEGVVKRLSKRMGRVVGYKAGAVTREAQVKLGVNEPVRGTLLRGMLLPNGAVLPAKCGVKPVVEADLVVTVKDAGINQAQTVEEIAAHLKDVVAFIEIPDSVLGTQPPPDVKAVIASNVGARLGVMGERRKFQSTPEFIRALGEMKLTLLDGSGNVIASDAASQLFGHPLNVVRWMVEDMRKSGVKLRRGDVLSLGAVKMVPPKAGQTVVLQYDGLPGGPLRARVRFE